MKNIQIDDDLYQHIVANTQAIGESASSILRRLLKLELDDEDVFELLDENELKIHKTANKRFLAILSALHQARENRFDQVVDIQGKGRLYFSTDKTVLEQSGSSVRPKQIKNSPYWVITNTNSDRKKVMLTQVAQLLGYSEQAVEKLCQLLLNSKVTKA